MAVVAAGPTVRGRLYQQRLIVASSLGNALEWFDFIIFGFLAARLAELFFPTTDANTSVLLVFATFGITFVLRPLGAVLLGGYADRHGRRQALVLSIALMTLGSAIIGFSPTHQTAGLAATALVVFARALQGLSAGGEFGAMTAFMTEQDPSRRGYLASWPLASQGLATILATGCGVGLARWLTAEEFSAWGWRIPFLLGVAVGPVAFYIRSRLDETPAFRALTPLRTPVRDLVGARKLAVVLCAGVMAAPAVMMYVLLYLPTYAQTQLGLQPPDAFAGGAVAGAEQLLVIPLVGRLSDRGGRTFIPLAAATILLALSYPLFVWMSAQPTPAVLILVQAIIGLLSALYLGPLGAILAEQFPPETRTSGVAVGHAIGVTLFGGLAPFIFTLLVSATGDKLSPSAFVALAAAVSLASMAVIRRGARPKCAA